MLRQPAASALLKKTPISLVSETWDVNTYSPSFGIVKCSVMLFKDSHLNHFEYFKHISVVCDVRFKLTRYRFVDRPSCNVVVAVPLCSSSNR